MAKFFRPLVLALLLLGTVVDMSAVFGGPGPVYYSPVSGSSSAIDGVPIAVPANSGIGTLIAF